jgi:phage baseplate assembly protein W
MTLYNGYSTVDNDFGPYKLSDNDLIVRDLLNHLNIRKGEKLMNPNFGCIIWNRLFDPLTPALQAEIQKDIDEIVRYDPRFSLVGQVTIQKSPDTQGLILNFNLVFNNTNEQAALQVLFDQTTSRLYVL